MQIATRQHALIFPPA